MTTQLTSREAFKEMLTAYRIYTVSLEKNGVFQSHLIKTLYTPEYIKQYYETQYNAKVYGVQEATMDDYRPSRTITEL